MGFVTAGTARCWQSSSECGLRRAELANLPFEKIQIRQDHWVIVDLVGKGGHVRTIPIPQWAKEKLDRWTSAATISSGRVFPRHSQERQGLG